MVYPKKGKKKVKKITHERIPSKDPQVSLFLQTRNPIVFKISA